MKMKQYLLRIKSFYREGYSRDLFITCVAFAALLLISFVIGLLRQDLAANIMDWFGRQIMQTGVIEEDGSFHVVGLFYHNAQAMTLALLSGFIPFLYFSALHLGTNSMLIGLFAAVYINEGNSLLVYLAGILPHGIFEIPALLLSIACSIHLCRAVTDYCRTRKKGTVSHAIRGILPVYLCIILPLVLIAALVEAYITPAILQAIL